jgi:hypothetical protein
MRHLAIILTLGVLVCIPAAALATTYTFQTVISAGDPAFTQTLGINNAGTVAGYFGDGTLVPNNGFTVTSPYGGASFTPENFPGSAQTQVIGINNNGETVGFYVDGMGNTHGFKDVGGSFSTVDNPAGNGSPLVTQLLGVNDTGEAAGYYTDASGNFQPFTYNPGSQTFTAISFSTEVSAQATDVNNAGDVTGFNINASGNSDGFLDVGGAFTQLDFPGAASPRSQQRRRRSRVLP